MKVIYCAGEQGQVVLDILRRTNMQEPVVFVDDDPDLHGVEVNGIEVIGGLEAVKDLQEPEIMCLVAFGDEPSTRLELARRVKNRGHQFFNAIDDESTVSTATSFGVGITVNAQAYIGPGVSIGNHALIDSSVNVSHDSDIGEGATITPNVTIAGGVTIGKDVYVAPGATILENITVGDKAVIGAGAVVMEDVDPGDTVVGVPAESLKPDG